MPTRSMPSRPGRWSFWATAEPKNPRSRMSARLVSMRIPSLSRIWAQKADASCAWQKSSAVMAVLPDGRARGELHSLGVSVYSRTGRLSSPPAVETQPRLDVGKVEYFLQGEAAFPARRREAVFSSTNESRQCGKPSSTALRLEGARRPRRIPAPGVPGQEEGRPSGGVSSWSPSLRAATCGAAAHSVHNAPGQIAPVV